MMNKNVASLIGILMIAVVFLAPGTGRAERTKVVVIKDIVAVDCEVSSVQLITLTESVYAAATEVSPELFSVVSREKMLEVSSATKKEGEDSKEDVGAVLGADMVFVGELRQTGVRYDVTLKLVETGSGRILGLERASAQGLDGLWNEVRKVARQILMPLATADLALPPAYMDVEEVEQIEHVDFLIQFRSTPADSQVKMDGKVICKETPCSYRVEPGEHVFVVSTELYNTEQKKEIVDGNAEMAFELKPKEYNYFGMHDTDSAGFGITIGVSPLDTEYKSISVLNGTEFSGLHPIFDVGFGGEVFGYRQTPGGSSWSILGFGPSVRAGRLILSSNIHLLSFRPDNNIAGEDGWLPGVSVKAQLPLINHREVGGWAALVPTPTIGYDIWFADLDYDQQQFWLGLSWLGGIDHD